MNDEVLLNSMKANCVLIFPKGLHTVIMLVTFICVQVSAWVSVGLYKANYRCTSLISSILLISYSEINVNEVSFSARCMHLHCNLILLTKNVVMELLVANSQLFSNNLKRFLQYYSAFTLITTKTKLNTNIIQP